MGYGNTVLLINFYKQKGMVIIEYIMFENEIAKKTSYDGYYATKSGKVISVKVKGGNGKLDYNKPRMHSYKVDKDGYFEVCLSVIQNGKQKRIYCRAHRLIWETYNGKIQDDLTIDHIDGNNQNNSLYNLQLLTRAENTSKAQKGRISTKRKLYKLYFQNSFCGIFGRKELEEKFNLYHNSWFRNDKAINIIEEKGYKVELIKSVEDIEKIA